MCMLTVCNSCIDGDHKNCKIGESEPGYYGGWRCTCKCGGDPQYNLCEHGNSIFEYCPMCHAKLEKKASRNVKRRI